MNKIIELIKQSSAKTIGKTTSRDIEKAQDRLHFIFPEEYRTFLENFGAMVCGSNELYGLGIEGYMNVVESTIQERKLYPKQLDNVVVIKNEGIEGILLTLDDGGNVFEFRNGTSKLLYNSFKEFLEKEILE